LVVDIARVGGKLSVILMLRGKTTIALAMAVAVVAVPVIWQEHAIARIREGNREQAAALEQARNPAEAGTAPAAEEDQVARRRQQDRAELEQLRADAPRLRAQLDEASARAATLAARATNAATKKSVAHGPPPPGFTAFSEAREAGSSSATAMFQSIGSALARGDTNRIFQLTWWPSEEAREMGARELADMAAQTGGENFSNVAFRVIREVPLPDGDVALVLEVWQNGQQARQAWRTRRVGGEWRQVIDGRGAPETVDLGPGLDGN